MKSTDVMKKKILSGESFSEMVIQKDGKVYWKHDQIKVDKDRVTFWYQGTPTLYIEHTAVFEKGDTLNIDNIEGQSELEIT